MERYLLDLEIRIREVTRSGMSTIYLTEIPVWTMTRVRKMKRRMKLKIKKNGNEEDEEREMEVQIKMD